MLGILSWRWDAQRQTSLGCLTVRQLSIPGGLCYLCCIYVLSFMLQKSASIVRFATGTLFVVHCIFKFGQIRSSSGRCDWRSHGSSRHVERLTSHVTALHRDVTHQRISPCLPLKSTPEYKPQRESCCAWLYFGPKQYWTGCRRVATSPPFHPGRCLAPAGLDRPLKTIDDG